MNKCGWVNVQTGETGSFDKNNKPVSTIRDKIKFFFRKLFLSERNRKFFRNIEHPNKRLFEFDGVTTADRFHNGQWVGETNISIYINHYEQIAMTHKNQYIDYNAWTKHRMVCFLN